MSRGNSSSQELFRVVSDLGQLKIFTDPLKVRALRVLQHQQVTITDLADLVECPSEVVQGIVSELLNARLVERADEQSGGEHLYQATARIFQLFPSNGRDGVSSDTITPATMARAMSESVSTELIASLTEWPDQVMNAEGRRARISLARALEFNEKLKALVDEYWGGPDQPVEESSDESLMSFIGLWYRFPEKK